MLQATPKWLTKDERRQLIQGMDHIVPFVGLTPEGWPVSGLNVPWNLQPMDVGNNASKGSRMTLQDYELACSLVKA